MSQTPQPNVTGFTPSLTPTQFPLLTPIKNLQDLIDLLTNQGENAAAEIFSLIVLARQTENTLEGTVAVKNSLVGLNAEIQGKLDVALADAYDSETSLRHEIKVLRSLQTNGHQRKSATHPDPDVFDGSNPKLLQPFLIDMAIKLKANTDWYPTEQDKMAYLFSRLSGKAKGQLITGVSDDGIFKYTELSEMTQILQQSFGSLNRQAEASATILPFKQGHKSLADFLPDWMELQGLTQFDDLASIAILKSALHGALIDRLSYTPPHAIRSDLVGFIAQVREADTTLRGLDANYHKKPSTNNVTLPPHAAHVPLTTTQGGDAMDLSAAVVWTAKDVSRRPRNDQEREARKLYNRTHGLCLWCNSKDHFSVDCKTSPWYKNKHPEEGKA